ncbi:DNA polymerase III subunit delta, partial [Xanthomonas citri pv. citri]|nr:DNA polymerase III subunit delta [Xanthomonas citri pv. citri]
MSAARSPRSGRAGRTDPLAWRRAEPAPLMLLKGPEDH